MSNRPPPPPRPAQTIHCPICNQGMQMLVHLAGQVVSCPHCQGHIQLPGGTTQAEPPIPQTSSPFIVSQQAPRRPAIRTARGFTLGQRAILVGLAAAVVAGLAGVAFGAYASQHFPFWGFLVGIAEPYSPARLSVRPGHCIAFGTGFALIFGGLSAAITYATGKVAGPAA